MEGQFVPLFSKGAVLGGSSATSKPGSAGPQTPAGFRLLNQPNGPGASDQAGKPQVTLRREGDRVTQIRVQCACGQVIELECVY